MDSHVADPTAPSALTDEADAPSAVAARLALVIGRLGRLVRQAPGDLSYGQLSALSSIARLGPLRLGELSRIEGIAAPTVTRLVSVLEDLGYVVRTADSSDGRASVVEATDAGRNAVAETRAARAQRMAALLQDFSEADLAALAGALDALEKAAGVTD
jgi:DNA-binding MarR family transcriptional regulator